MKKKLLAIATAAAFGAPLFMADAAAKPAAEASKPKFAEKEYDLDTGVVTFTFGNGTVLNFDTNELSAEMRSQLMLHGMSQKGGDSYAGAKGNYSEAIQNVKDVWEQLKQGVWRAARGEGDAKPRLAELAEAIARIKQVPIEASTAAVEAGTEEQRKAWRGNAKVKAVIAQIRAEKAAKALEEAEAQGAQTLDINVG